MNAYQTLFELHAELLKALAHPRRLEILQLLRHQPMHVSQIQEMLNLPQANISQHLQILRESGIVATERNGKEILYSISDKRFVEAADIFREILVYRHQNDELGSVLSSRMLDLVPLVTDPVCGMRISPKTASGSTEHDHTTYYFCAAGCQERFSKEPTKYV